MNSTLSTQNAIPPISIRKFPLIFPALPQYHLYNALYDSPRGKECQHSKCALWISGINAFQEFLDTESGTLMLGVVTGL